MTTHLDDAALERLRELTQPTTMAVQSPTTLRSLTSALWTGQRLAAAGGIALVLLTVLAVAAPADSWWVLVVVAGGTGLALSTYLPAPAQPLRQAFGGVCGIAGLCLPLMGVSQLAQGAAGTAQGYAVALVVVGLAQRVITGGSCGTPSR